MSIVRIFKSFQIEFKTGSVKMPSIGQLGEITVPYAQTYAFSRYDGSRRRLLAYITRQPIG